MTVALRLTEDDFNKLTPGERLQVRHLVNSGSDGREFARRYIASITQPEVMKQFTVERNREWFTTALNPLGEGQSLTVAAYSAAIGMHPARAGAQLVELMDYEFVRCIGNRRDPARTYSITESGLAVLSLGRARLRLENEGFKSALISRSATCRDEVLMGVTDPLKLLNKIKRPPTPFVWEGQQFFTSKQVAEYYGITAKGVTTTIHHHRVELEKEGLTVLAGATATQAKQVAGAGSSGGRFMIWPPRVLFRFGLLLRESSVAIWLRQVIAGGAK